MLQILRNNTPYATFILFIFTLVIKAQALLHPVVPHAGDGQVIYGAVLSAMAVVLGKNPLLYTVVGILCIYLQALYINRIARKHRLYAKPSFLPAYTFLVLTSVHPGLSQFNIAVIINWCLLFALDQLLSLSQSNSPDKKLFNAGFLFMLAALTDFSLIFFILFFWVALAILRPFNIKEWTISLLGILMPVYFLLVILFLSDRLAIIKAWPRLYWDIPAHPHATAYFWGTGVFMALLLIGAAMNLQRQMGKLTIFVRRCWLTFTTMFVLSLVCLIFSGEKMSVIWLICLLPQTFIIANVFYNEKSKLISTFGFYCSLALLIYSQVLSPL